MILYFTNSISRGHTYKNIGELLTQKLQRLGFQMVLDSGSKYKMLRMMQMLLFFFRKQCRANLIMINVYSTLAFYYALSIAILSKLFGKPYLLILHGGNLPTRLKRSPRFSKFLFSHSALNIAPSKYLREAFIEHGYKVKYVPNDIAKANYPFKPRSIIKPNILWVRSFHQIYNPVLALEVLALVSRNYPNATLCMVGPVKDHSQIETQKKAIALGLENKITYTGKLSLEDWKKLSENYDLFINTTTIDNMPVSVIEIMALGLPIVSTNVGGLPYLLNDGIDALLVNNGDAPAMAAKLELLLNDAELVKSLTSKARAKAETFDWEVVQYEWKEILEAYSK